MNALMKLFILLADLIDFDILSGFSLIRAKLLGLFSKNPSNLICDATMPANLQRSLNFTLRAPPEAHPHLFGPLPLVQ